MIHLILIAFPLLIAYIALALIRPVHRCGRCRGRRVVRRGRTAAACTRCRGSGKAYRTGAVLVQQTAREHVWPWLRDRIRDRIGQDEP